MTFLDGEREVSERQLGALASDLEYRIRNGDEQLEQRLNAHIRELRTSIGQLRDELTSEIKSRQEEKALYARLAVDISRAKVERYRSQGAPLVAIAAVEATGADIEHAILHGQPAPEVQQ